MSCKNHPEVPALGRCSGCAEPHCDDCLVEIDSEKYCAACKVMALKDGLPVFEDERKRSKEARDALVVACIGLFLFGLIFGIIALVKANAAKQKMNADPEILGRGMASAAQVIGVVCIGLWALSMVARVMRISP